MAQKVALSLSYWSKTNIPFTPRHASWSVFDVRVLSERDGFISLLISGAKTNVFANEAGTHSWQRVSPTERKGRVHTSLITVAVLPVPSEKEVVLKDSDLDITTFCCSGNGGQSVQKNRTGIRILHKNSGITVTCQNERSLLQNKKNAMNVLRSRLNNQKITSDIKIRNQIRIDQISDGSRGRKIRTVKEKDNIVVCEVTKNKKNLKQYLNGHIVF